jgi:hypothetical protein
MQSANGEIWKAPHTHVGRLIHATAKPPSLFRSLVIFGAFFAVIDIDSICHRPHSSAFHSFSARALWLRRGGAPGWPESPKPRCSRFSSRHVRGAARWRRYRRTARRRRLAAFPGAVPRGRKECSPKQVAGRGGEAGAARLAVEGLANEGLAVEGLTNEGLANEGGLANKGLGI